MLPGLASAWQRTRSALARSFLVLRYLICDRVVYSLAQFLNGMGSEFYAITRARRCQDFARLDCANLGRERAEVNAAWRGDKKLQADFCFTFIYPIPVQHISRHRRVASPDSSISLHYKVSIYRFFRQGVHLCPEGRGVRQLWWLGRRDDPSLPNDAVGMQNARRSLELTE